MKITKLGWAGIIGGGAFLVYRLMGLKQTSEGLNISPTVTDVGIQGMGIYIKLDVSIQNPNKGKIKFTKPYLQLYYNGGMFGSSSPSSELITVEPMTTTVIKDIVVRISFASILQTAGKDLYNLMTSGSWGEAKIEVKTITNLWGKIPYSTTDTIPLKKA